MDYARNPSRHSTFINAPKIHSLIQVQQTVATTSKHYYVKVA